MGPADSHTRITLLQRLAGTDPDEAAWAEFVEKYGPKIYGWCLRWNLQEADAEDVTQQVLLKLAGRMKTFTYDPAHSFRAWLKTVTRHAWQDFEAQRRRPGRGSGDSHILDLLCSVEARESLLREIEEEFDQELLEEAMRRVRQRVAPHTWEAFRLATFEGISVADVAERLHMKIASVYKARGNVLAMLRQEREKLEAAHGEPSDRTPEPIDFSRFSGAGP